MTLTRGYLLRHFQGCKGGFFPAMLDVAQDHLLTHLYHEGLFDLGLIFKGGTSLRKMRAGARGRFSTDLDFCVTDSNVTGMVLDLIDGASISPFAFRLTNRDDTAGRANLIVLAPFGPQSTQTGVTQIALPAKVEISPRPPWLTPEQMSFLPQPIHKSYDIGELPVLPVVRVEEAIAEKLARYARIALARDLFDLVWYGRTGSIDQDFIRRLWILKVYNDVVLDNRWRSKKFDPAMILNPALPRK